MVKLGIIGGSGLDDPHILQRPKEKKQKASKEGVFR